MKLWETILANIIDDYGAAKILELEIERLFEKECYKILERIKTILEDDSLEDKDCFDRIERIICLFEKIGSGCGTRHDFG